MDKRVISGLMMLLAACSSGPTEEELEVACTESAELADRDAPSHVTDPAEELAKESDNVTKVEAKKLLGEHCSEQRAAYNAALAQRDADEVCSLYEQVGMRYSVRDKAAAAREAERVMSKMDEDARELVEADCGELVEEVDSGELQAAAEEEEEQELDRQRSEVMKAFEDEWRRTSERRQRELCRFRATEPGLFEQWAVLAGQEAEEFGEAPAELLTEVAHDLLDERC